MYSYSQGRIDRRLKNNDTCNELLLLTRKYRMINKNECAKIQTKYFE